MSAKDLIAQWEEALAVALSQPDDQEMYDDALTTVTPVEGDWIGLRGSAEGALWVAEGSTGADRASGGPCCGSEGIRCEEDRERASRSGRTR